MIKKGKRYLFLLVGLALLWVGLTVACQTEPPVILKFSSSPAKISTGESAKLSWVVKDATSVSINHGVGVVENVGNKRVSPPATITYTLIATNSGGTVAKSAVVTVSATSTPSPDTTPPVISVVNISGTTQSSVTITWTTNETATSQVEYGLNTSYGSETPLDTNLVTSHSVTLSGLTAGTTYHFRVKSKDASGNEIADSDRTFTTTATADTTPPVISAVNTSGTTNSSVTITWTTNEAATNQVMYGLTTSYGSTTPLDTNLVTSHSVTLSGLSASTTYHFKVKSKEASGNEAMSGDFTFTTSKEATEVGGIISSDTTWTKTDSPYVITSTVQIPTGVTLTIELGVTISKPTSGDMFLLLGTMYAHGTAQEPIVFDGGGNSTIVGTHPGYGNGNFEYCVFKNGGALWDRWGKLNLRHSQLINLTLSSQNAISGAIIKLDGPSGEINIEYNKFVNTGGIYSYANKYGINVRYNMFNGLLSPLCNAGGGTSTTPNKMVVKFNSFVNIEGIILSLEPVFSPTIDATENYWGTTDIDVINLKIHDGKDDVRIGSYITYLPILTSPHPSTPRP